MKINYDGYKVEELLQKHLPIHEGRQLRLKTTNDKEIR